MQGCNKVTWVKDAITGNCSVRYKTEFLNGSDTFDATKTELTSKCIKYASVRVITYVFGSSGRSYIYKHPPVPFVDTTCPNTTTTTTGNCT